MSTLRDPNDLPVTVGGGAGDAAPWSIRAEPGDESPPAPDAGRGSSFSSVVSPLELLVAEQTELKPGGRLDRYELLCPVASGGMGKVWIARMQGKHGFERLVALKTILPHRSEEPRLRRMFLDEARIASDIDHVNVARILDLGDQAGVLYLVMEWVHGDSLAQLQRAAERRGGRVSSGVALRVIADACSGLQAAHDLRDRDGALLHVVHRDVSPQNILLSEGGVAKIIDFGIAKAQNRVSGDTTDGALKGKLLYMAPEQALGRDTDRRADVYSLGAVLYSLLAGRPPFKGENDAATFGFVTSGLSPPPLPRHVPAPVVAVVRKALARLEDRYCTAAELRQAIEGAMIESYLTTSREEVAAYVDEHLGGRMAARRALIERAIEISDARELTAAPETPRPVVASQPQSQVPRRQGGSVARLGVLSGLLVFGLLSVIAIGRARVAAREDRPHDGAYAGAVPEPAAEHPSSSPLIVEEGGTPPRAPSPMSVAPRSLDAPKPANPFRSQRGASPDCTPPYALDSSGIRHYKRACFR